MKEITATVLENTRIAEDIYSLTFSAGEKTGVRPGQFCMIGLAGYPLRRPIAICKAEGERVTVCYRLKGSGTRFLAESYKQGEKLDVLLSLGNGFFVKEEEQRIAIVGGGVGIFPLISAIRAYQGKNLSLPIWASAIRTRYACSTKWSGVISSKLPPTTEA